MATIILKNNDTVDVTINDLNGFVVPFGEQVTASNLFLDGEIYESVDLKTEVTSNNIIVNDGSSDLSVSDGLEYLTPYNINNNSSTVASQDDALILALFFGGRC